MRVRQVDNVLDLFELFGRDPTPRTLTDLSQELAMPKSSTFNLIETLVERGFLYETRHRGGYFPTRRLYDVAWRSPTATCCWASCTRNCSFSRAPTGESVLLSVREGDHVIYVDVVESPPRVRYPRVDRRPASAFRHLERQGDPDVLFAGGAGSPARRRTPARAA